jgi:hypothetical protein
MAMLALAVLHGAAWSVAWSARLAGADSCFEVRSDVRLHPGSAVLNAGIALGIGAAIGLAGPSAIVAIHVPLGAAAALALMLAGLRFGWTARVQRSRSATATVQR